MGTLLFFVFPEKKKKKELYTVVPEKYKNKNKIHCIQLFTVSSMDLT